MCAALLALTIRAFRAALCVVCRAFRAALCIVWSLCWKATCAARACAWLSAVERQIPCVGWIVVVKPAIYCFRCLD